MDAENWKKKIALNLLALSLASYYLTACVTNTLNSDGTIQNQVPDKNKLADTYIDLAIEYEEHDAPQVALERANLAIKTDSGNARAYMIRAMINQSLNQNEAADQDFQKALSLKDNYAEAYVNYAVFLCDQKRYMQAYQNFAIALTNPLYFNPEVGYYSRGKCYYQQGNQSRTKTMGINKNSFFLKYYESANNDFLKSLSYRNPPQDVYISLARLHYQQGHYQAANYYINRFGGTQTAATVWLHIQILQALIDQKPEARKFREYTDYRAALADILVKNYANSQEAEQYMLTHKYK